MVSISPSDALAEVFGFPADVQDADVQQLRALARCPFRPIHPLAKRDLSLPHGELPFDQQFAPCTKGTREAPLGVCSLHTPGGPVIVCPVRFTEGAVMVGAVRAWVTDGLGWPGERFTVIPDVPVPLGDVPTGRNTDRRETSQLEVSPDTGDGQRAGRLDYVLALVDSVRGQSRHPGDHHLDACVALEVQPAAISGNLRRPFEIYMEHGAPRRSEPEGGPPPRPDWLSSVRKGLAPRIIWKGRMLHGWNIPLALCLQEAMWPTLAAMQVEATPGPTGPAMTEVAWVLVDLVRSGRQLNLVHARTVYSAYDQVLLALTRPPQGSAQGFRSAVLGRYLQQARADTAPEEPKRRPGRPRGTSRKRA